MVARGVRSAEGIVGGGFGRGGGGWGREGVPRLHGHVDADDQVVVVEAAEEVGEQRGVFGGEADDGGFLGVVVGAAAELGEEGGEVDDVCGDGEGGFEAADEEGDGFGVGVAGRWVSEDGGLEGGNGTDLGGGKAGEVGDGYEDAILC